jgi:hypothetical protein
MNFLYRITYNLFSFRVTVKRTNRILSIALEDNHKPLIFSLLFWWFSIQPILVYMSKVDGKFLFCPVSVNFLTEFMKVVFAVGMLLWQVSV